MSQFDESKLSRILARRIIAPEDRSQFLPLCTPIYCPDNNGVKASQVTIIDPNLNTFFDDVDPTNTRSKYIGSQLDSTSGVRYNSDANFVGSLNIISETGDISNFSTSNYISLDRFIGTIELYVKQPKSNNNILGTNNNNNFYIYYNGQELQFYNSSLNSYSTLISSISTDPKPDFKLTLTIENRNSSSAYFTIAINDEVKVNHVECNYLSSANLTIGTNYQVGSVGSAFQGSINGYETLINDVPLIEKLTKPQVTRQPHEVQNIINIDLNKSVSRDYFVPYEVELKSDADIMSVVKSDFAAYFKNRVSNEIVDQLVLLHTTNTIPTINMGATLAEAFGEVLTSFISQGTGQKFSIYKYNNGAPVVYSVDSNQPNIDKDINQTTDMTFAIKDDINVPALYYVEQPTLILPNTTYVDYQTELCNGNIKEYARKMINVETATADFSQLGKGVFGTNDTFAVAFSSPSIKLVPDTNFYGYRLCCTMLYGVKLVHKHNLRLFI